MENTLQPAATEQSNEPLFCKDCVHYFLPFKDFIARCAAPQVRKIDLVVGFYGPICSEERADHLASICGSAGKLFAERSDNQTVSRQPYARQSRSAESRSSLSSMNLASADNSAITTATASAEYPGP